MPIIGVISQKGGVGKSTLARAIAVEAAKNEWNAKIADLDLAQKTSTNWLQLRLANKITPKVRAEPFDSVASIIKTEPNYDLIVVDGRPAASKQTIEIAAAAQLIVLPCGVSGDDLDPTFLLARELANRGVPMDRIVIVFNSVPEGRGVEHAEAFLDDRGFATSRISATIPHRAGYVVAQSSGRAITETAYTSLNERADAAIQAIFDRFAESQRKR